MSRAGTAADVPEDPHEIDGWDVVNDPKNFLALESAGGHSKIRVKEIHLARGGVGYRTICYDFATDAHDDGRFIGELMAESKSTIPDAVAELELKLRGGEHADVAVVQDGRGRS